ncbi:MAG TPA: pseudouridine synthase [Mesorhizobium sp.]|uniref:pseudouridine synthase n=1 Tax=Mesorhizobium sp. TaxID=1871066 RepID=UPI002DDCBF68|nr:pseudouridine synthase [Mesorhizobium sp.]HEV2504286.1 pseudouridine synthase [Mesorhizobium sp.]
MDDKDNKPPRSRGPRTDGPRGREPGKGGKPGFGKKPFAKRFDGDKATAERPRGDFKPGGGKPWQKREDGGKRPFEKGARGEGKPFVKRDGPRKPYAPREDRAAEGERPRRDFADRPRSARSEGDVRQDRKPYEKREGGSSYGKRPFEQGARGEGKPFVKRDGPRKPYAPRGGHSADAERPKRDFTGDRPRGPRPEGGFRPDRKPYEKREGSGSQHPGRFERGERKFEGERSGRQFDKESGDRRFERPKREFDGERKPFQKREGVAPKRPFDKGPRREAAPRAHASAETVETGERIAKRLARAGIASRRDAEELIAARRVKVNGQILTSPAFNVSPDDVIHLDGTEIPPIERTRLFLFHKPAGVVTTNRDPEGRKTVFDVLPAELPRLMTIGRLDINTEGLLLLTNDGGLSRVLELPATGWLRRYRVRVHGKVEEQALADLRDGIAVDGVFYGAIEASLERTQGTNAWLTIGLREGKNREVKNILGALGLEVNRLIRVSYGPFQLGELPEGHVQEIKGRTLREQLGETLIEEAGANFDADITMPFSNKPVRRTEPRPEEKPRPKPLRDGDHRPAGEGGLIKARKRREGSRDEALGKLSTKPDRGGFGDRGGFAKGGAGKGFGERGPKKGEREQRPIDPPGQRRANVWMAPGARPQGAKAERSEKPGSGKGGPRGRSFDDKGGAPRGKGPGKGPRSR